MIMKEKIILFLLIGSALFLMGAQQIVTQDPADPAGKRRVSGIAVTSSGTVTNLNCITSQAVDGTSTSAGAGDANKVVELNASGKLDSTLFAPGVVIVEDQKSAGTDGGTFTSGSFQTRVINTEVADPDNLCTISSNQITLQAGTYRCWISCPAYQVDSHKSRLRNITDGSTTVVGTTCRIASTSGSSSESLIIGRFTIASTKTFEIQHQCETTGTTTGFGEAANMTEVEVYTRAMFIKE